MLSEIDDFGLEWRDLIANVNTFKFTQILEAFWRLTIKLRQYNNVRDAFGDSLGFRQLVHKLLLPPGLLIRVAGRFN